MKRYTFWIILLDHKHLTVARDGTTNKKCLIYSWLCNFPCTSKIASLKWWSLINLKDAHSCEHHNFFKPSSQMYIIKIIFYKLREQPTTLSALGIVGNSYINKEGTHNMTNIIITILDCEILRQNCDSKEHLQKP